ncbi:MAG: hypothetical protein MJ192_09570, partial [Clostridia bacterium]|nr:hypothetical protein [Clostridia bacterium]
EISDGASVPSSLCGNALRKSAVRCDNMTEITLHAGVTQVSGGLYEDTSVQVTRFTGTMDEWKAVKMVDLIRTDLKVICSDGIINDR